MSEETEGKKCLDLIRDLCKEALNVSSGETTVTGNVGDVETPQAPEGTNVTLEQMQAKTVAAKNDETTAASDNKAAKKSETDLTTVVDFEKLNVPADVTEVKLSMSVTMTGMEMQAKAETTAQGETSVTVVPKKITYDVEPVAAMKKGESRYPTTKKVKNDELNGKPITFRLPVSKTVANEFRYADVTHKMSDGSQETSLGHPIKSEKVGDEIDYYV